MPGEIEPGSVICALVGPTAVGKSAIASKVAPSIDAEIISVDSMQVYRGMDIGTSKPTAGELTSLHYHLVDVVDPSVEYSAASYKKMADSAISGVQARGKTPLMVGGSGLYYRAVVDDLDFSGISGEGWYRVELQEEIGDMSTLELYDLLGEYDPHAAEHIPPGNRRRILRALEVALHGNRPISERQSSWSDYSSPYRLIAAGLETQRSLLYRLIESRVDEMVYRGLEDEVKTLVAGGLRRGTTAGEALGYRQVLEFLDKACTFDEAIAEIKKRTRNYAKRQLTWFKRDPRIRWFTIGGDSSITPDDIVRERDETASLVLEYFREKLQNDST